MFFRLMTKIVALIFCLIGGFANAEVIAAIELGSKGVKVRVIDINTKAGDSDSVAEYKILYKVNSNPGIIDGAKDGFLSTEGIERGAKAVAEHLNALRKFDPVYSVIVASTSLDLYNNRPVFERRIRELSGIEVKLISGPEEIYYAMRTSIRPKLESRSMLLDIGSGNTKLGFHTKNNARRFESFTVDYGTANLAKKAIERGGDYSTTVAKIIDEEIRPVIRKELASVGGYTNIRRRIYMEGGTPWAVSSFSKPLEINKPYTYLNVSDVRKTAQRFTNSDWSVPDLPQYAEDGISEVLDVFPPHKRELQAGSALLVAVLEEIKADTRPIIFNRDGGWVIGYLMASYLKEQK
jgi:hypothetical protein